VGKNKNTNHRLATISGSLPGQLEALARSPTFTSTSSSSSASATRASTPTGPTGRHRKPQVAPPGQHSICLYGFNAHSLPTSDSVEAPAELSQGAPLAAFVQQLVSRRHQLVSQPASQWAHRFRLEARAHFRPTNLRHYKFEAKAIRAQICLVVLHVFHEPSRRAARLLAGRLDS